VYQPNILSNHVHSSLADMNGLVSYKNPHPIVYLFYFKEINFNFILPQVNTDYIRQTQVMNTDKLRLIKIIMKILIFNWYKINK